MIEFYQSVCKKKKRIESENLAINKGAPPSMEYHSKKRKQRKVRNKSENLANNKECCHPWKTIPNQELKQRNKSKNLAVNKERRYPWKIFPNKENKKKVKTLP